MKFIAHRGITSESIKENTIESIKQAIDDNRFVGFEFDVRITKDNVFVLCHDPIYKGKLIKYTNYKELKKYKIPRLIDILKLNTDKIFLIEIKDYDIDLEKLTNMLNKYQNKKLYLMSFSKTFLHKIYKYKPKCKLGVLNYIFNSEDNYQEYDFICLINGVATDKLINYFKCRNIEIFIYGIIDKSKLINKNVYYIIDEKY
ncbi:MAG: glycerophosphodiester phosphodiesterase [Bacilli bacterium]|nr:glycerophosphodiester phosphodiesterase [Bacilli bacterium]